MWPSLLTGLLLAMAFPLRIGEFELPNLGWLAWIALVPLFVSLRMASPWEAFRRTFVAAVIYYGGSLYWVYTAMYTYGHLSPAVSGAVLLLMVVILATYIGMAPLFTRLIARRLEHEPLWLLPSAWVAIELARNYGPCGGFPWINLAQSQYAYTPLIQVVDLTGISGLAFAIVWTNRWLAHVVARCWGGGQEHRALGEGGWRWAEAATWLTFALLAGMAGYGAVRFAQVRGDLFRWPSYGVALLQGNIPQEEKWRPGLEEEQLSQFRALLSQVDTAPIDLVVWPEASYPWAVGDEQRALDVGHFLPAGGPQTDRSLPWPMLIGALRADGNGATRRLANSVFGVGRDGTIVGRYDKTHLVPFGEYVPYRQIFSFARKLAAPIGNLHPGEEIAPITIEDVAIGPLICYEDIFPEIARAHALRGAHFFANLTNDAWYGWSGAARQHMALSVFRAVENRRYLVRATNTGMSAIVDPLGRVLMAGGLFEPAVLAGQIRLGFRDTIYTRFGDWFAYACIGTVLIAAGFSLRRRRILLRGHRGTEWVNLRS
ncbi:MAG: apolipoprotein N-acyltransferase [Deltaproteobacteria bacterium]|nr:apolipoprotein N-acyltransferase [Deltaproteobacteria bacterium]